MEVRAERPRPGRATLYDRFCVDTKPLREPPVSDDRLFLGIQTQVVLDGGLGAGKSW